MSTLLEQKNKKQTSYKTTLNTTTTLSLLGKESAIKKMNPTLSCLLKVTNNHNKNVTCERFSALGSRNCGAPPAQVTHNHTLKKTPHTFVCGGGV